MNDRPASLVNVVTYLFGRQTCIDRWQTMVWCQQFGVNIGFSNKYRILMENLYLFKGYRAKTVLRNFLIKVGDCRDWTNFWKAARNWHDGKTKRQHWKHTESFFFFFCSV